MAPRKASSVFSGQSPAPPRCAKVSGRPDRAAYSRAGFIAAILRVKARASPPFRWATGALCPKRHTKPPRAFVLAGIPCYPIRGNGKNLEPHWDFPRPVLLGTVSKSCFPGTFSGTPFTADFLAEALPRESPVSSTDFLGKYVGFVSRAPLASQAWVTP